MRAPPERFLRNFRRECRSRGVPQPAWLPPDPVLWRQRGAALQRTQKALREQNRTQQHLRNAGIRAKPINPRGASMAFDEGIAA